MGGHRYYPARPLPPYGYLPGRAPHPTRDPGGHLRGAPPLPDDRPDPARWHAWPAYLYGVDLFNHGYYWEAHEAWEQAWHACGRRGDVGDLLRGLIHLAGAGFATRRGKPAGRRRHARLAAERFGRLAARPGQEAGRFLGLDPASLVALAERIASGAALREAVPEAPVVVIFDAPLRPG